MNTASNINNDAKYPLRDVLNAIGNNKRIDIRCPNDALAATLLADISLHCSQPIVVLTPTHQRSDHFFDQCKIFGKKHGKYFPEFDVGPYHQVTPDRLAIMQRVATFAQFDTQDFIFASIRGAVRKSIPLEEVKQRTTTLSIDDVLPDARIRELLNERGFLEVPVVEDLGTFAIRGDIVDLFSPTLPFPVRIERWGDDVSEMRLFNPKSQRTVDEVDHVVIPPVRETLIDDQTLGRVRNALRKKSEQEDIPSRTIRETMTDLEAGLQFIGVDALVPAFFEQLEDIFDYAERTNAIVVAIEPELLLESVDELIKQRELEYAQLSNQELAFEVDAYYRTTSELKSWLEERCAIVIRALDISGPSTLKPGPHSAALTAESNDDVIALTKVHKTIDDLFEALDPKIETWSERFQNIAFVCQSQTQTEKLQRLLLFMGYPAESRALPVSRDNTLGDGQISLYTGPLAAGFRSEPLGMCLISGAEVFGRKISKKTTENIQDKVEINHFRDLKPEDLIVHVDFGIGRYRGLERLTVGGITSDFLHLEYLGEDKLYIPVFKLARIQKYIGSTEGVRIDKLGGTTWEKTKDKVKENIREVASELLRLYAKRELQKGFVYSPPDEYYHKFENAFPFDETPDQARAIDDTISDMTSQRPMDRLICGDVGFGKTEVAIRAAMKATLDGKQVAVLVPTTILCEQHVRSFRARLKAFGVRVEGLSRFRSSKEAKAIKVDLAEGKVDVVIGTHRLLSKEITYKNLGLLIVDEEQRFGVTHKEKIKALRSNIDILTLTATPIPRTLHMSLLGLRDLSIIATPPNERLSVRTHLARFNDGIIREAVMREMSRGGQVFFVHNRVGTIYEMEEHIKRIVPEARIVIGHGQMPEQELEDAMVSYVNNEAHILLATSIIESGLDIPNANTIIVNRADMFGLSQLYQLRGRVGRGRDRAYCYLLVPSKKLTADAAKRLEVIQTYTDLGSGFHVATYDMEIRGAGNMLGSNQSGHVAQVGLDLYSELLDEAIADMRGESLDQEIDPEVNIPGEAFIPEEYIDETSLRLLFYKRLSLSRTTEELDETRDEMVDRFGGLPEEAKALVKIVALKIAMVKLRALRVDAGPSAASIHLDRSTTIRPDKFLELVESSRGKIKLTPDMKVIYNFTPDESADPINTVAYILEVMQSMTHDKAATN